MTQQTMTKEQILESRISCTCNEAYKTRQMSDPDCGRCNWYEEILSCMEEYKEQEVAKEREKSKKLVEFAERLLHLHACEQEGMSSGKPSFADWITATNNLQHEIDQYKQSLTEYRNQPETTGNHRQLNSDNNNE